MPLRKVKKYFNGEKQNFDKVLCIQNFITFYFVTPSQLSEYWSFLLLVSFTTVCDDKYSNAMHINNCSLVS